MGHDRCNNQILFPQNSSLRAEFHIDIGVFPAAGDLTVDVFSHELVLEMTLFVVYDILSVEDRLIEDIVLKLHRVKAPRRVEAAVGDEAPEQQDVADTIRMGG